ncbi:RNA polymerase sigma factor [Sinanaerobacter sp. ZZT-01]|uniref:RNA polymerase sigma factor n=1 Tax=Sinanaerobacter sp. ZZT-01 TaxID=3111540 RepID=UPI002D7817F5|nr:RNA polymerase sigma factor [Sinanaerobacter sp. ZZT-01]WRR92961.1 RNA polymerase sigma factor [Sinanaerobacter sp. ZZT-01]
MGVPDFEEIYIKYFSDVKKYLLYLCRNEAVAEEMTQETFFKAMRYINKFNGSSTLYVWLCQIAKNTYFTFLKKQKKIIPEIDEQYQDTKIDFETAYLNKEEAKRLHILLHNLSEPYKEVFTLRVFGELPYLQIGELFGKTDSWARLIFYRAKKQLQEEIE